MVIGNFHANFDPETYKKFQEIIGKGNVSRTFQNFMLSTIATQENDIDGVDLKLINIEIEQLKKQQIKITTELQNKLGIRENIEKKQAEIEKKRLEIEKKQLENAKKCSICGKNIEKKDKKVDVKSGILCLNCYYSSSREQRKKWNDE
jgi:hypothetical protein